MSQTILFKKWDKWNDFPGLTTFPEKLSRKYLFLKRKLCAFILFSFIVLPGGLWIRPRLISILSSTDSCDIQFSPLDSSFLLFLHGVGAVGNDIISLSWSDPEVVGLAVPFWSEDFLFSVHLLLKEIDKLFNIWCDANYISIQKH